MLLLWWCARTLGRYARADLSAFAARSVCEDDLARFALLLRYLSLDPSLSHADRVRLRACDVYVRQGGEYRSVSVTYSG